MTKLAKLLAFVFFFPFFSANAKKMLEELDFSTGDWEMVGVSLHNYNIQPIQKDVGHFVLQNREILQNMKSEWDLEQTYNDYCEHHYALRFYRNGRMIKILKINLLCGYVTEGGLSYRIDPYLFTKYKSHYKPLNLSRVGFKTIDRIRKAIDVMQKQKDVWLYYDHLPYRYDGYFVIGIDNLPWNVDRDSVLNEMKRKIISYTGSSDFYMKQFVYFIDEGIQSIRYEVFCSKSMADKIPPNIMTARWRTHFEFNDRIDLVFVGVNKRQYYEFIKGDFE